MNFQNLENDQEFSDDNGLELGLSECARVSFKRGKLEKSDYVSLDEKTMIKDLEHEKFYEYLGAVESSRIQKLKKELVRTTRLILKTRFNSSNRITTVNVPAILVIAYSFIIID